MKKREAAIVFPTGYMANLGAITSLVDEKDTVIIDRLDHASIIDACRLSKAKLQVYPHKDMSALEKILQRYSKFRRRLVVTDAVFSMDGDLAPVTEIIELGKKYNAMTMADYAHATGVVDIAGEPDIVMGTLSKAVGSLGGFIAGSAELIDYFRNKARSFIYTTALPPAACAASLAAFEIIEIEETAAKRWTLEEYPAGQGTETLRPALLSLSSSATAKKQWNSRPNFLSAGSSSPGSARRPCRKAKAA